MELTDGPIPLVAVPGIRDAINIITFDYTEGRKTRGGEKGKEGQQEGGGRGYAAAVAALYPRFPGYRVGSHEIALTDTCTRTSVYTHSNILPSFHRLDLLTTLLRQRE